MNINCVIVDGSGNVSEICSMPPEMLSEWPIPAGSRVVILSEGKLPTTTQLRVDLDMLTDQITTVPMLSDVLLQWQEQEPPPEHLLEVARGTAISVLDEKYARLYQSVVGPMSEMHAEKRRQAEAGGGPLVADEEDRLAILENAAQQDAAVARIETERRERKGLLQAATTREEIALVMSMPSNIDNKI